MEKNDIKFEVVSVSYQIEIDRDNFKKLLHNDLNNEEMEKPDLSEILGKIKGVSNVDYNPMFTPLAIRLVMDEADNNFEKREQIIETICSYINKGK